MSAPGFIYIIHAQGTTFYKVGKTSGSVESRMRSLVTSCPYPLMIVKSVWVDDADSAEDEAHASIAECRSNGEWFNLEPHQLDGLGVLLDTKASDPPPLRSGQRTYTMPATEDDLRRVDALVATYHPVKVTRSTLMHSCLELGLDALEAQRKREKK